MDGQISGLLHPIIISIKCESQFFEDENSADSKATTNSVKLISYNL